MPPDDHLLIVGASARAAAFSALRAGLRPWCIDLFADDDLRARCVAVRVGAAGYPGNLVDAVAQSPPGPWMYTGALENHPDLVLQLRKQRELWGNPDQVLRTIRSPRHLALLFHKAGIPHLRSLRQTRDRPVAGRWLKKPLSSAGGWGIAFHPEGQEMPRVKGAYYQEYIEGDPNAAIYLGDGEGARLLGVSHQLTGVPALHASPFHYCGSIGPLLLELTLRQRFEQLGNLLAKSYRLRGLFGVDCVLCYSIPFPVEVNPRYTASVEVLEYATGLRALALHRRVFDPTAPAPPDPEPATDYVGKAILFAREDVTVPGDGPWSSELEHPTSLFQLPLFADIPPDGQRVPKGWPILTFFARATSVAGCRDTLKQIAADLDRWLFGR
jgi:predicted ATP-grasp superfamily ATP-dependent carboligase